MTSEPDEDTTKTTAKTLWTETLLEILYESLRMNKTDKQIGDVLKEVQAKGFKRDYIIEKVQKKLGDQATMRIKALLARK